MTLPYLAREFIIPLRPRPHIRSTMGDGLLFRIPENKLKPDSLKRKKQLERYNDYKLDLADYCHRKRFKLPTGPMHVIFFLPMPKVWNRERKASMNYRPHMVMPDTDNLFKALSDGLLERDQEIHDVRIQKVWINDPDGWTSIQY